MQKEKSLIVIEKNYASIGIRFLAVVIDNIILIPFTLFPALLAIIGMNFDASLVRLLGFCVHFLYCGFFYSRYGKTPGKMLFQMQVVDVNTGMKPNFLVGGLRDTLGRFIDVLTLGIGYVIAIFRQDKRALHDLLFNTVVIRDVKLEAN